jgi:3-hydroxyisobutyrate dehydrogenase/glyoxylate/succinic semialdehyde reductase
MQKDMHLATVSAYEAGVAMPLTNVTKEVYRLAMRDGHDTEDFSAIYEYLSSDSDIATIDQKSPAPAKVQLHQAN